MLTSLCWRRDGSRIGDCGHVVVVAVGRRWIFNSFHRSWVLFGQSLSGVQTPVGVFLLDDLEVCNERSLIGERWCRHRIFLQRQSGVKEKSKSFLLPLNWTFKFTLVSRSLLLRLKDPDCGPRPYTEKYKTKNISHVGMSELVVKKHTFSLLWVLK